MNIIEFTIAQSNPNKTGGYVWKLTTEFVSKVFGIEKLVKRTFYIGNMPVEGVVNTKIKQDMDAFEVKEYAFQHPDTGEMLNLKWLHVKSPI
jgi:hypothetical protein